MGVEEVVARLERIPDAVVGRGPRHPVAPDASIEADIRVFLDTYAALRRDACYVDFLETYAGAAIQNPEGTVVVHVLGFSDTSLHMLELDAPVVDDGLLLFALCVYHTFSEGKVRTYEYDFAFDVSNERKPGVYRYYSTFPDTGRTVSWYADDFCMWLTELVEHAGVFDRLQVEGA